MASELEEAIDALYRGSLAAFIPARNALAKQLKDGGDAEAAKRVKALAKPSVSAWALNQLWWSHRARLDALLTAGERIRTAQLRGAGPVEQAAAGQARRQALTSLVGAATEVLASAGHAATAGTLRKVTTSLEAAAAYGRAASPDPPLGRRATDLEPPGFEVLAALAASSGPTLSIVPNPEPEPAEPARTIAESKADLQRRTLQRELDQAQARADAKAREVDGLARDADDTAIAARRATERHEAAQQTLREAQRAAESAELAALRANKTADATATALAKAQSELTNDNAAVARAKAALESLP